MYIGLDVHKQKTCFCIMDGLGHITQEGSFDSTPAGIKAFCRGLSKGDQVALESTTNAIAIGRELENAAGRVVVSNPVQTKAIACARIKTDQVDARVLAHLLRTNFLPEVYRPEPELLERRHILAHREQLVSLRTCVKNQIHSILHRNLITPPEVSDLFGKKGLSFLARLKEDERLPRLERWKLGEDLGRLQFVGAQIDNVEREIAVLAAGDPDVDLLITIPGISWTTAAGLQAAIGPIARFTSGKKMASYFGLTPSVHQSGNKCYLGSISKAGRKQARHLLVEASQSAVRSPGPLQAFFLRLKHRKGHNVALVAVANKLARIIWKILTERSPYTWAPPLRTQEKRRALQLKAGASRVKTGPKKGQPSQGGRAGLQERRKADCDLARQAQAQYEELVRSWNCTRPVTEAETPPVVPPKVGGTCGAGALEESASRGSRAAI